MQEEQKAENRFLKYLCNITYEGNISNKEYQKLYDEYFEQYESILTEIYKFVKSNYKDIQDNYILSLENFDTFPKFKNSIIKYLNYYILHLAKCECKTGSHLFYFRNKLEEFNRALNNHSFASEHLGLIYEWANVIENIHYFGYYIFNLYNHKNNTKICCLYSKGCKILNLTPFQMIYSLIKNINGSKPNGFWEDIIKDITMPIKQKYSYTIKTYNGNSIGKFLFIAYYAYKKQRKRLFNLNHPTLSLFDYKGVVGFQSELNNNIIVGFSGTQKINHIIIDLSQITGISPGYIIATGIIGSLKEKYPNKKIIICGHSLGGGLSQFAAIPFKNVDAYCFNSAGLFPEMVNILEKLPYQNTNITHIRLEHDLVSMLGKLYGNIYTMPYNENCIKSHFIESIASCFSVKL